MCTPRLPTRSISACSTSTVARASSRARWVGCARRTEQPGQGRQPHAGRLLADEHPAGQPDRAQHRRVRPGDVALCGGGLQEADVEAGVVRHQHRAAAELQEHRQHRVDRGGVVHHRGRDSGEPDDLGRDVAARIDEGGKFAEDHPAAHLDRADLGDRVARSAGRAGSGPPAGGLEVDDDECGVAQRHIEVAARRVDVGEAQLRGVTASHPAHVRSGPRQTHPAQPPLPSRAAHASHGLVGGPGLASAAGPIERTPNMGQTLPPGDPGEPEDAVVIDCDDCAVRGPGCRDCVVSVLLGVPETLLADERAALEVLAEAGLAPRLRLVPIHHHSQARCGLNHTWRFTHPGPLTVKFRSPVGQRRCRFVTYLRPKAVRGGAAATHRRQFKDTQS